MQYSVMDFQGRAFLKGQRRSKSCVRNKQRGILIKLKGVYGVLFVNFLDTCENYGRNKNRHGQYSLQDSIVYTSSYNTTGGQETILKSISVISEVWQNLGLWLAVHRFSFDSCYSSVLNGLCFVFCVFIQINTSFISWSKVWLRWSDV